MSARILERAAACVWQASRRLLTGYRLTGAIDPFAYRTVAGATACGTPALERMAKGTLRLVREAELEMALARRIDRLARPTRTDEPQALLGVRRRRTLSEILHARLPPAGLPLPKRSFGSAQAGRSALAACRPACQSRTAGRSEAAGRSAPRPEVVRRAKLRRRWNRSVDPVFREYAY